MDENERTRVIKFGIIDEYDLTYGSSCYHSLLKIGEFEHIAVTPKNFIMFNSGKLKKSYDIKSICAKYIKSHHIIVSIAPNPNRIQIFLLTNLYQPIYTSEPIDQVGVCHIIFSEKHQIIFTLGIGIKSWLLEKSYTREGNIKINTGFRVTFLKSFAYNYMAPLLTNPCWIESKSQLVLPSKDGIICFDAEGNMLKCPISLNSEKFTLYLYNENTNKALTSDGDQGVCLWNKHGRLKYHFTSVTKPIYIAYQMTNEFYIIYDSSAFISIFDIKTDRVFPLIKLDAPPLHIFFERERGKSTMLFVFQRNKAKAYRVVIPWSLWRKVTTEPLQITRCPKANGAARIAVLLNDASIQLFSPVTRNLLSLCHARITGFPISVLVDRGMQNMAKSRDQLFVTFDNGRLAVFGTNGQLMEPALMVDIKATCCALSMFCQKWCLLIGTSKGDIIIYEYRKLRFWKRIGKKREMIYEILHHDDTMSFFVIYKDVLVRYNTETGNIVDEVNCQHGIISTVCGFNIVIGYEDGTFNIFRITQKNLQKIHGRERPLHKGKVTGITAGRSFFVTSGYDGSVLVWSNDCEVLVQLILPLPILSVAFLNGKRGLLIGTPAEIMIVNGSSLFGIQVDPEDPLFDNFDRLKDKMNGIFQLFDDFENCEEEDINFLLEQNNKKEEEESDDSELDIDPNHQWVPNFVKMEPIYTDKKPRKKKVTIENNKKEEEEWRDAMGRSMKDLMDLKEMEMIMEESERAKEEEQKEKVVEEEEKEEEEDLYEYVSEEEDEEVVKEIKKSPSKFSSPKSELRSKSKVKSSLEKEKEEKKVEGKTTPKKSPKFKKDEKISVLSSKNLRENNSSLSQKSGNNSSLSSLMRSSKSVGFDLEKSPRSSKPPASISSLSNSPSKSNSDSQKSSKTNSEKSNKNSEENLSSKDEQKNSKKSPNIDRKSSPSHDQKQLKNESVNNQKSPKRTTPLNSPRQKQKQNVRKSIVKSDNNNENTTVSEVKLEFPSSRYGSLMGSSRSIMSDSESEVTNELPNNRIEIETKLPKTLNKKKKNKSPKGERTPILHTKEIGIKSTKNKNENPDVVFVDDRKIDMLMKSLKSITQNDQNIEDNYEVSSPKSRSSKNPRRKVKKVQENLSSSPSKSSGIRLIKHSDSSNSVKIREPQIKPQMSLLSENEPFVRPRNPRHVILQNTKPVVNPDIDIREEIPPQFYFDKKFLSKFIDVNDAEVQQMLRRLACFHGASFDFTNNNDDDLIYTGNEGKEETIENKLNFIKEIKEYLRQYSSHKPRVFRKPNLNYEDENYYNYERKNDIVNHHPRRITVQERSVKLRHLQEIQEFQDKEKSKFKPLVDFGLKKESLSDFAHIFERANKRRRASAQSQRSRKIEKPIKLVNSPRSSARSGKV